VSTDFAALRRRFPVLARKTYLNSGSYCALADSVREAIERYMEDRLLVGANWEVWVGKNEAVRARMARLLGAQPGEIAVTASASAGINSLASALDFHGERNKVVVTDFEFPTSAQIWHAQAPRGAQVVHVPADTSGYIPLENFAACIDARTQLVAVTHVCFRNGARLDIEGVVKLAHARGARVLLDCYQAVGAIAIDVRRLGVDFAVGGMLKYLLGTAGLGFLYVRAGLLPALVPGNSGWFAQEDIFAMEIHGNHPAGSARRFEAGTPAVVNCYAAEAGLDIILEVGADAIERRIAELTERCFNGLESIGWPSVTLRDPARHGPMVCVPARRVAQLQDRLSQRDIITSWRDANLRATFHFYNTADDVDALLAALETLRDEHRPTCAAGA
jgi:selenocysteine lyase/cysteine desulfurase